MERNEILNGLPLPVSVGDFNQRAILDVLLDIRDEARKRDKPTPMPEGESRVKEPKKKL